MNCGVVGYGGLGKAIEKLLLASGLDVRVFSRRGEKCGSIAPSFYLEKLPLLPPDLAFLCVGSAEDSFTVAPKVVKYCDTIDCFDDHENMKKYLSTLDLIAKESGHRALIGAGWDPGIFSLARKLFSVVASTHTFYGEGVSLGHSNALRNIGGVEDALCYTIPLESEYDKACKGGEVKEAALTHKRKVIILPYEGADRAEIARQALDSSYFKGYECEVVFCCKDLFEKHKNNRFHQGRVFCTGEGFNLALTASMKDNANFTAKIMTGLAGVVAKLQMGAYTLADIPLALLSGAFY